MGERMVQKANYEQKMAKKTWKRRGKMNAQKF
jgi:hypothetical protein